MRVFLDANVLFTAAHNPDGKAALLLELGRDGIVDLVTCALALEEARRNVRRKCPAALADLDRILAALPVVPTSIEGPVPAFLAGKDRPILLSAVAACATHLVRGDRRHFGALLGRPELTAGVLVCTVAELLADGPNNVRRQTREGHPGKGGTTPRARR